MLFHQQNNNPNYSQDDQDDDNPISKYFTGKISKKQNDGQPQTPASAYKRSNSLNKLNIQHKSSIMSMLNRRDRNYQALLKQKDDEFIRGKCSTEQDTQTTHSLKNNQQEYTQLPLKIKKKTNAMQVQPKQIELNVESNYHLASVYYVQNMKSLLQTPRYQTTQSEKDYLQKLSLLNNNSSKMKNSSSRDYLLNSPLSTRPTSSCFRIVKRDSNKINLAINSRKSSKQFGDKELEEMHQQTELLEQYNQMTTKSSFQILNSMTQNSIAYNNLSSARLETKPAVNTNINPITKQIEIQGSNYSKTCVNSDNSKRDEVVLKNEYLVSKLKQSECFKDKTQINQQNLQKIIQLQRQYKQNLLNNQISSEVQVKQDNTYDKEQEDNSKKYFELIQSSIRTIEEEEKQSQKVEQNDQLKNQNNKTEYDNLKLNQEYQQSWNYWNDAPNKNTSFHIFSNIDLNQVSNQIPSSQECESTQNTPISSCLVEDQIKFDNQQILMDKKLQNTNSQQILTQQRDYYYQQQNKPTNILQYQNLQTPQSNKPFNENIIPFKSFSKVIKMNQALLQQNMQSQKFDTQRSRRKNLLLEKFNFDTQKYKQIQIKIEKTQNRLLNNNYL